MNSLLGAALQGGTGAGALPAAGGGGRCGLRHQPGPLRGHGAAWHGAVETRLHTLSISEDGLLVNAICAW